VRGHVTWGASGSRSRGGGQVGDVDGGSGSDGGGDGGGSGGRTYG
jgi:hypothetical protein